jgi:hypothetical protein
MILSKVTLPSLISFRTASLPIYSTPISFIWLWNSSDAKAQILMTLPSPDGRIQVPLMFWSLLVGLTFIERMSSKLSLHLRSFETFLAASKMVVGS